MKHDWRSEFKRLEGAYAPATMKSYYTDVRIFEEWCLERAFIPFPAVTPTVCAFLEDQAALLTPSSVRRRLYAIRKAHRLLQLPEPPRSAHCRAKPSVPSANSPRSCLSSVWIASNSIALRLMNPAARWARWAMPSGVRMYT